MTGGAGDRASLHNDKATNVPHDLQHKSLAFSRAMTGCAPIYHGITKARCLGKVHTIANTYMRLAGAGSQHGMAGLAQNGTDLRRIQGILPSIAPRPTVELCPWRYSPLSRQLWRSSKPSCLSFFFFFSFFFCPSLLRTDHIQVWAHEW